MGEGHRCSITGSRRQWHTLRSGHVPSHAELARRRSSGLAGSAFQCALQPSSRIGGQAQAPSCLPSAIASACAGASKTCAARCPSWRCVQSSRQRRGPQDMPASPGPFHTHFHWSSLWFSFSFHSLDFYFLEGCDVEWLAPTGGLVGVGSI